MVELKAVHTSRNVSSQHCEIISNSGMIKDARLACFCGYPWAATIPILSVLAGKMPWSHGNKVPMAKRRLGKCHGTHGKKGYDSPERNPFRATMLHNDES